MFAELKKLKIVNGPKIKRPVTWNRKTWEVMDADGKVISYLGPKVMRALKNEVEKHHKTQTTREVQKSNPPQSVV